MLPAGRLMISPGSGHMVHHTDLPLVLDAVDAAAWPSAQITRPLRDTSL
jgi:hypothetical protein